MIDTTMKESDIQLALFRDKIGSHKIMMPNYTPYKWYECDMMGVTKSGYMREWEIKISKSDFKADALKGKKLYDQKVRSYRHENKHQLLESGNEKCPSQFWYVVPEDLIQVNDVPDFAGLIYARERYGKIRLIDIKNAPRIHRTKVDDKVIDHIKFVLYYRYWNEKAKVHKLENNKESEIEMPCDYSKYPDDWKKIRKEILERACNMCELCEAVNGHRHWKTGSTVVLTIAHINQDIKDNRSCNLLALCQRCHNKIDMPYRVDNRKENARKNNRAPLFEDEKGGV